MKYPPSHRALNPAVWQMAIFIFKGICQTPPVFKSLPHGQPFVRYFCHAFCPTARAAHPGFVFRHYYFFKVKTNRQEPPRRTNKKTRQKSLTPSYINIMRYYRNKTLS